MRVWNWGTSDMSVFQVSITDICNANCPFCISRMTPGICHKTIDWDNFEQACKKGKELGCKVGKITGKGEPLLVINDILKAIKIMRRYFDEVELQTNGILLQNFINELIECGLDRVSISCVHYLNEKNREIYGEAYPDLVELIRFIGGRVDIRLSCTLVKGFIDSVRKIEDFIKYWGYMPVGQLTFIPVGYIGENRNAYWAKSHAVDIDYPAKSYSKRGRSVWFRECLGDVDGTTRHLIYFPDGKIRTDWTDINSDIGDF